jgi:hypothetical protein
VTGLLEVALESITDMALTNGATWKAEANSAKKRKRRKKKKSEERRKNRRPTKADWAKQLQPSNKIWIA